MAVWLCSGQGAQQQGMGADFLAGNAFPEVTSVFETVSRVTGVDVARLASEGTADEVQDPFNAQVLTVALSIGVGRELKARGYEPEALVGFSLGQVSALALSDMLTVEDVFALLKVRATAMAEACKARPGAMSALLKATHEEAQELCEAHAQGQVLVAANFNCPGQVVISGEIEAVDRAEEAWCAMKGKRASRLRTAGGFHSPLKTEAAKTTGDAARELTFREPQCPVLCNTDGKPLSASDVADRMEAQVKSPVMFEQSIAALLNEGATSFVEVGFGGVLTNLVKRIDRTAERAPIGTVEEFDAFVGSSKKGI